VYDWRGLAVSTFYTAEPIVDAALAPDGRTLGVIAGQSSQDVELAALGAGILHPRRVFAGAGLASLAWSPNGRWLLVSWPAANQWVFVRVGRTPRILAVSRIRAQFGVHGSGALPRLDGWCCTAAGTG
jgi:hypothetical protein